MAEKTLAQKLKLAEGARAAVLNAPPGYLATLLPLQPAQTLPAVADWIQLFARDRAALEQAYPAAKAALPPAGLLWISFPKGGSGMQTDLGRDKGWQNINGLKWVTLVSINDEWSGFCLRPLKAGEAPNDWR